MAAISDGPDSPVQCANPDCRVAETGRCVDGLELKACTYFGEAPDADIEADHGEETDEPPAPSIKLRSADTLSLRDASAVLRAGPTRLIAIVGPSDAGKTSLIAGLYDLFQRGKINNVCFARSQTLRAFEAACHDARSESRRAEPHINRTPYGEVTFYHLEVAGGLAGEGIALLLGDRAGEEYREAANDSSISASLHEILRADTITVLIDGDRLLGVNRHNVRIDAVMILEGLLAGDALAAKPRVALVLTKLDAVMGSQFADRVERDFAKIFEDISQRFGHTFQCISLFRVAASPKSPAAERGAGVSELLDYWMGSAMPPVHTGDPPRVNSRMLFNLREISEPEAEETND